MRQLLITLLFTGLSLASSQAQEFLPIVKEGAVWYQYAGWGVSPDVPQSLEWTYTLTGDTIIDSLSYKKVLKTVVYPDSSEECYGAIREDSGKVYFKAIIDSISGGANWCFLGQWPNLDHEDEVLLYDFSLSIGDTLYNQVVVDVSIIDLGDGTPRKRIDVEYQGNELEYWVEGVGSAKGLFECGCFEFENVFELVCYYDDEVSYPLNCTTIFSTEEHRSIPSWSISPNPASGQIKITTPDTDESEFIIRNMLGEAVLRCQVREEAIIDVSDLPAGFYSVSLFGNGVVLGSRKLVVSD